MAENNIFLYGFDKNLNRNVEVPLSPMVYDSIEGATQAQRVQFGSLGVGSGSNVFRVEPEKGQWMGAEKFEDAKFSVDMSGEIQASNLFFKNTVLYTAFESIDAWTITDIQGTGSTRRSFGDFNISSGLNDNDSRLAALSTDPTPTLNLRNNKISFQTKARTSLGSNAGDEGTGYIAVGYDVFGSVLHGFGFKFVRASAVNSLYAFWHDGTTETLSPALTGTGYSFATNAAKSIFKAVSDPSAGNIKYYIDGVLVHTFSSMTHANEDLFNIFTLYAKNETLNNGVSCSASYISLTIED